MSRTHHDMPAFIPRYWRWSPGQGRYVKRQLSKARRRMFRQGRERSFVHWSREANWKCY